MDETLLFLVQSLKLILNGAVNPHLSYDKAKYVFIQFTVLNPE